MGLVFRDWLRLLVIIIANNNNSCYSVPSTCLNTLHIAIYFILTINYLRFTDEDTKAQEVK